MIGVPMLPNTVIVKSCGWLYAWVSGQRGLHWSVLGHEWIDCEWLDWIEVVW